jgi:uncharacterized protein YcfJ
MEMMQKMRIHPLMAGAAVAVIIASAVAVAAMTGHLPGSNAAPGAAQQFTAAPPPASPMVAVPAPVHVPPPVAVAPAPRQVIAAAPPPPVAQAAPACPNCGVVASVKAYSQKPKRSTVGMIGGGVVGALVGNEIGDGNKIATIGGAAGGAYLGNKIGQKVQTKTRYKVVVRMDDGRTRSFTYAAQPGFRAGSHVRVENGTLVHG